MITDISEVDKAYAAGIFDGEGCITSHTGSSGQFKLKLMVQMTDYVVVSWLYSRFGGSLSSQVGKTVRGKTMHCWELFGRKGQPFILLTMPYLKTKKAQAEIALQIMETFHDDRRKATPETWILRNQLSQVLKEMKL